MTSLVGQRITAYIGDLCQVSNSGTGIDGTLRAISSGTGTASALQVSTAGVKFTGTVAYGSSSVAFGGNFSTTGTFSSGGNFSTSSTVAITGALSIAGAFSTIGANSLAITTSAPTAITLPNSGTLSTLAGSETLTNKTITNPKITQINDANGNTSITNTATGSAVNYLNITNGATGSGISLAATGSDSAVNLALSQKGAARVDLGAASCTGIKLVSSQPILDANNNKLINFNAIGSAVNYLTIVNNSTTNAPQLASGGSDTNINLTLATQGTGTILLESANTTNPVTIYSGTGLQHLTQIITPNTSATRTLTLPDNNIDLTSVYFSYGLAATQSVGSASFTKVQLDTNLYDNKTYWDGTNFRFTPQKAGVYQISAGINFASAIDQGVFIIAIYKNGSVVYESSPSQSGASSQGASTSGLLTLNGSTDYIELFAYRSGAGSVNIGGNAASTFLTAVRICAI